LKCCINNQYRFAAAVARNSSLRIVNPVSLPHVWRVSDLASDRPGLPTGYALLDRALPGGGWPAGSMVEVLQQRPGQHVWQLLLPGLSRAVESTAGPMVLVGAPFQPFGPSLQAQGLPAERLLCIQADQAAARLWAAEQALRCAEVAAVLAWLPQARAEELRRLHMAAQQQSRLLFVFRGWNARHQASPAILRLLVEGVDSLELHILKRRGPPLLNSLELPARGVRLAALLNARKALAAGPARSPAPADRRSHGLVRAASIA
jgi:protein ImuA